MGQVCAKHNEYYENECRWCEAPETPNAVFVDAPRFGFAPLADVIASTREAKMRALQRAWTGHDPDACRICRLSLNDGMARTGHLLHPVDDGHGSLE